MPKLPYQYVAKHVDEMYDSHMHLSDEAEIDKHCELISAFIQACGWDEIEFSMVGVIHALDYPYKQEEIKNHEEPKHLN